MKKQIIKQLVLGATLMGSLLTPMVVKAEEYPGGVNVYYEDVEHNILNGNPEDIDSNDIVINSGVGYGLGLIQTKDKLIELKDNKYNFVFIGNWSILDYLKKDNHENGFIHNAKAITDSIATTTYEYRYKNDPELQQKKTYALIGNRGTIDRDIVEFVNNHIVTKNLTDHDLLWYYDHQSDNPEIFENIFNGPMGEDESKILYKYNAADDDYVENAKRDLKKMQAERKAAINAMDAKIKATAAAWEASHSSNSGSSGGSSSGSSSTSRNTRSKRSVDTATTTTVSSAGTWTKEGTNWKLIKTDGSVARGWVMDNGKWYFLDPVSGNMRIGWSKDGDNWYFLNPDGSMATNWVHHGDSWYYLQGSGVMARGWIKSGNDWYFLSESGSMLKSTLTPDGYKLDASGKWVQ